MDAIVFCERSFYALFAVADNAVEEEDSCHVRSNALDLPEKLVSTQSGAPPGLSFGRPSRQAAEPRNIIKIILSRDL